MGLVAAVLSLACGVASAAAKTVNVTIQSDPQGLSGDCQTTDQSCSLRQAIYSAQDGDTIVVPAGSYANILGGGAEYLITANNLTITGAGPGQTIVSGAQVPGNSSRVFQVAPGKVVTIRNMTITGGHVDGSGSMTTQDGGGVLVGAPATPAFTEATLDNVDLIDNSANIGGGAAVLNESTSSFAYLIIENSVVEFNTTTDNGDGGGLAAIGDGRALVIDSTVARNTAGGAGNGTGGGAIALESAAGGMTTGTGAEIGLGNATVAYNTAGGDGAGGNITLGPTTSLASANSIIAGGIAAGGNENCLMFGNPAPTVVSADYNYEGDHSQCDLSQPHDQASVPSSALLSPNLLANGATSRTVTLALVPGSPAINGGDPAGCAFSSAGISGITVPNDQRGIARPQGAACDAGAFEFQMPAFTSQTTTLSGTATVGDALTCAAPGTSSPDGPATVTYSWFDGATKIAGQSGPHYTLQATDQGQTVTCAPTVANGAGSVAGPRSSAVGPVAATPGGGRGPGGGGLGGGHTPARLAIGTRTVRIGHSGKGTLTASCTASPGDNCTVTGALFGPGKLPAAIARERKRPKAARKLGTISGALAAGQSGPLTIELNAAGRRLLARRHRVSVRLLATVTNPVGTRTPLSTHVTLIAPPAHKPRRH